MFLVPLRLPDIQALEGPGLGSSLLCPRLRPDDLAQVHSFEVCLCMATAPRFTSSVLAFSLNSRLGLPAYSAARSGRLVDRPTHYPTLNLHFHPPRHSFRSLPWLSKWLGGTSILPVLRPKPVQGLFLDVFYSHPTVSM